MKKVILFTLLFIVSYSLSAQEMLQPDELINFDASIQEIITMDPDIQDFFLNDPRYLLLDGYISSIDVSDGDVYTVLVEFTSAEWKNETEIESSSCFVYFWGDQYREIFPTRPQRNPTPAVISINTRVILLALVDTYYLDSPVPDLVGFYIRKID